MGEFAHSPLRARAADLASARANDTRANGQTAGATHTPQRMPQALGNQGMQRLLRVKSDDLQALSSNRDATPLQAGFTQTSVDPKSLGTIQAKLTVSPPGDIYEKQADRVSERAMRMSEPQREHVCACGGVCSECQTDRPDQERGYLQMRPVEAIDFGLTVNHRAGSNLLWHQLPTCVQSKLTIAPVGDIYEQEADRIADEVVRTPEQTVGTRVQRECFECDEELHQIQRQPETEEEREETTGSDFQAELDAERASGSPLPDTTRQFMESRFDVDFGQVRIHTGERASRLSKAVQAQAFTVGNHIYFGAGRYNPGSPYGNALIAHELVHTLQQAPNTVSSRQLSQRTPAPASIQRSTYTFAPKGGDGPVFSRPWGKLIHSTVLPMFIKANRGSDLFVEVKIPGAKKHDVFIDKVGVADFYKGERTIGIRFEEDRRPSYLFRDSKFRSAREEYDHRKNAAPIGPMKGREDSCDSKGAQICRLDKAPTKILLGDLKPGGTAETLLGTGQIEDYQGGIALTRDAVNDFINKHPESASPEPLRWDVEPSTIPRGTLIIPPELEYPKGAGIRRDRLSVFVDNQRRTVDSQLDGALYVYEGAQEGIWSYEWLPELQSLEVPERPGLHANVNRVLVRLDREVIAHLWRKPDPSSPEPYISPRPEPADGRNVKHTRVEAIQRQPVPEAGVAAFNLKVWEDERYGPWKKDAQALLWGKDESGEAPVAAALVELSKRSGKIKIPAEVEKTGKDILKIDHWVKSGAWFGRLRGTFGRLFSQIAGLYERIKTRFEQWRQGRGESLDFGSGIIGTVAKVAFGLMKQFLVITIKRVGENLAKALKSGAVALLEYIFSGAGAEIRDDIKVLQEEVKKIEGIAAALHEEFDKKFKKFLDTYEQVKTFLDEVKKGLEDVKKVESIVKWGVRLFHCVTPPILGCLKLALEKLTEYVIQLVVKGCWFQGKVILPLFNKVKFFRELPQRISNQILEVLRDIIPLPDPERRILLPEVPAQVSDIKEGELQCAPDQPTPEQRAIEEMIDKYGEERVEQMFKLLEAKGLNEGSRLTVDDIGKVDRVLGQMSKEDLEALIKDPDRLKGSKVGKDLEDAIKDLKKEDVPRQITEELVITPSDIRKDLAERVKGHSETYTHMQWPVDKVKDRRVDGVYYTRLGEENVAAFVHLEIIDLSPEKKSAVLRITGSSALVNARGETRGSVEERIFEGELEVVGKSAGTTKR